ncbi:MAG: PHB depolymerase family esterase [Rikenellaceae bacterium]|nr:PHB depolymerase family esterase [Rikenellaceae bacterium]
MNRVKTFILFSLSLLLLIGNISAETKVPNIHDSLYKTLTINNQGLDREYKLYIPKGLKRGAPLLFVLHGYGRNFNLDNIGFNEAAKRYGFAVCYPQGSKDGRGKNCWNVGYPFQADMKVDDVEFLCSLAAELQREFGFSRRKTFCTGMSNGGEMCYLLAYCGQKVFKAVAPIAGLTMEWMPEKYPNPRPIRLFEIHGTEDRVSEWTGDLDNKGGWGAYIAVPDAISFWVKRNECNNLSTTTLPIKKQGSNKVISHKYSNMRGKNSVWLYEIVGGAHSWGQNDLDICDEIWKFFSLADAKF